VPTADDLDAVRNALSAGGTVILMKIGKRLDRILDILEEKGMIEHGVFVSHAGMGNQSVETNLRKLRGEGPEKGLPLNPPCPCQITGASMKVYFVGAGPGDPELLTVKAERLLKNCEICIYAGSLVSEQVLDLLPRDAERHDSSALDLQENIPVIH